MWEKSSILLKHSFHHMDDQQSHLHLLALSRHEDHVQEYINEQCHNRRHNIHESMGFYKKNKKRD